MTRIKTVVIRTKDGATGMMAATEAASNSQWMRAACADIVHGGMA